MGHLWSFPQERRAFPAPPPDAAHPRDSTWPVQHGRLADFAADGPQALARAEKEYLMMKHVAMFALVACTAGLLAAEPAGSPQLRVALHIHKSMATKRNTAQVILINSGKTPITVLSQGLGQGFDFSTREKRKGTLSLSLATVVTWQKHRLVASKYRYLPVTLQPGEATKYELFAEPFRNPFKRLAKWPKLESLTVEYAISAAQAKRYGVWAGTARSVPHKVVDGEIQAE